MDISSDVYVYTEGERKCVRKKGRKFSARLNNEFKSESKMKVNCGVCATGFDEGELCVGVCTPRIIQGPRGTWEGE